MMVTLAQEGSGVHWRNREHAARLKVVPIVALASDAQYLPLPESSNAFRARFLSESAMALKRATPMFTSVEWNDWQI